MDELTQNIILDLTVLCAFRNKDSAKKPEEEQQKPIEDMQALAEGFQQGIVAMITCKINK